MSWKDVLVFADSSAHGAVRAMTAGQLAAKHGAQLTVSVFARTKHPDGSTPEAVHNSPVHLSAEKEAKQLASRVESATPALRGMVSPAAPIAPHSETALTAGELGATSDLIVLGYPSQDPEHWHAQMVFDGALFKSGRPCLVLPGWSEPKSVGRRVLIAWTTSREAARAVHDALPLLTQADEVQLFASGAGADFDHRGPYGLARIEEHLGHHGVKLAGPCIGDGQGDIGHSILNHAAGFKADLVVMGGYGHSPAQEMVIGGATRKVLEEGIMPVLFAH